MNFLYFAIAVLYIRCVIARQTYRKSLDLTGSAFYDEFWFYDSADPTHGRVTYVSQQIARNDNLSYATQDTFILRADDQTYLVPSDPGRDSFRLVSRKQFTTSVMVFDIRHMPVGCGTWPAVWTVGSDWPDQGEVDILEGVNNLSPNTATLHTGSNCHMPSSRNMTGRSVNDNCAAYETGNQGCGVQFSDFRSFGPLFNSNGGGWFALERDDHHIKVWFWPRDDASVPVQVKYGSSLDVVEPEDWGKPAALWSDGICDIPKHFGPHNIVIDLTFCGDWAGDAWQFSGCPKSETCEGFVNQNPESFRDAYFDFAALRIYE